MGLRSLVSGLSPSPGLGSATYVRPPYQLRTNPYSLRLESHAVGELAFVSPHPNTAVSLPHTKHWRSPKSVWGSLSEAPPSRFYETSDQVPLTPCWSSFEALRPFGCEERQLARPTHPRTAGAVVYRGSCFVLISSRPLGVSCLASLLCSISRATTRKHLRRFRIVSLYHSARDTSPASVVAPGIV